MIVEKTESSLATTIDGEAVVLETESGVYFGLNEVATYIWERLDEPRSVAALREAILSEYDVTPERCARDLQRILTEFSDRGLVELRDPADE
jgi:hypothetical protein